MAENMDIMANFTEKNLPDLDTCVLGALELFMKEKLPRISINFKRPLVVGSGNAEATGRIIFQDRDAIFASESDFEKKIGYSDGVVLISASGGKHAPVIAKKARQKKKKVVLITNNPDAEAGSYAERSFVFPKQREPYTYNTSTYMGMILGKTKEDPKNIYNHIKKIKDHNFRKYSSFFVIVPGEFSGTRRMIQVKFMELFGRKIARDVETIEYMKHATTIVPSDELFISIGCKNTAYGKNRIYIPLPKDADHGSMMAVSYYIIGQIQKQKPDYFKKNISDYMKKASKAFGKKMNVIVE